MKWCANLRTERPPRNSGADGKNFRLAKAFQGSQFLTLGKQSIEYVAVGLYTFNMPTMP